MTAISPNRPLMMNTNWGPGANRIQHGWYCCGDHQCTQKHHDKSTLEVHHNSVAFWDSKLYRSGAVSLTDSLFNVDRQTFDGALLEMFSFTEIWKDAYMCGAEKLNVGERVVQLPIQVPSIWQGPSSVDIIDKTDSVKIIQLLGIRQFYGEEARRNSVLLWMYDGTP